MWRNLIDYGRRLFSMQQTVDRHSEELKEIRQELRTLAELVREYRSEQQLDHAVAEKDRENLVLRLENTLLRVERALPLGRPGGSSGNAS